MYHLNLLNNHLKIVPKNFFNFFYILINTNRNGSVVAVNTLDSNVVLYPFSLLRFHFQF